MSTIGTRLNTFHDQSGKITVAVFASRANPEQDIWLSEEVLVGHGDMIAIGGGGVASDGFANTATPGPGALLTASCPNADLSGWIVGARSHEEPQAFGLVTYVIGLSVAGMSRDELKDAVAVTVSDSGRAPHPEAEAGIPSNDFVLVGGGFMIEPGTFNLATASFPATEFSWKARSQDHHVPSPANIRAFAICLRRQISAGIIRGAIQMSASMQQPHPAAAANVATGFALTGGGAEVRQVHNGNFLWRLEPATSITPTFSAASKDHISPAPCPLTTFALGIQVQ